MTPEQLAQMLRSNPDLREANGGLGVGVNTQPVQMAASRREPARNEAAEQEERTMPAMLILPWPPSVNHYWQAGGGGRRVLSADAKRYKAAVGAQCRALGLQPCAGDVVLTVRAYRPAKRGDLDNTFKAVLDALKGYVYEDDAQVAEIHAYRRDDRNNPRIEVEVMPCTR